VSAVARLRRAGRPVILDLVGPAYRPSLRRLQKVIDQEDPRGEFVRYRGPIPFTELHHAYAEADVGIFASSCENQPIILLEGMAAGLPIVCSQRGPMPEVLGSAGMMFDPENAASITDAIDRLLHDPELRYRLALEAYRRTDGFTWQRTADQTLEFLAQVAREP
jgi:glycosyltransferase involved in cell wall biosynthesis